MVRMDTNFAPGTPNWVDLGSTDVPAAVTFYGELFGWTIEDLGPEAGGYGTIRKDGKRVAGISAADDPGRGTSWAVYFATDDADATAAEVEANGGKVVVPPMEIMDQGKMAVFQDPAGAFFSVWQPGAHQGAEMAGQSGGLAWVELFTSDLAGAAAFYPAVLGVTTREVDLGGGSTYTLFEVGGKNVAGAMAITREHDPVPPRWIVYFAVDDTDAVADKALAMGGSEMMRGDTPAGRLAFLADPQGGQFSIIEPDPDFSM
jgi:uncharacterized protein